MLSDFVALLWSLGNRDKQVLHSFVINLKHGNMHFVLFIGVLVLRNSSKNLFA